MGAALPPAHQRAGAAHGRVLTGPRDVTGAHPATRALPRPAYASPVTDDWFAAATAGSDAGALARATDWSSTPLGDPGTWPESLRGAVRLCFGTRFPIFIGWGPDLTMIYNDGYRDMLGTRKHPGAMGRPTLEVWAEIADEIGPLFDRVLASGAPVWLEDLPLVVNRSGYDEEATFTFSYSALVDDDGRVAGVLDIATETTTQVVTTRRLTTLTRLSNELQQRARRDLGAIALVTMEVLGRAVDVARADLHVVVDGGLRLLASTQRARRGPLTDPADLADALRTGRPVVRDRAVVAPLVTTSGAAPRGVLVLEAVPTRPFDDDYVGFLRLLASTVSTALDSAITHLQEVDQLRSVSETLQESMTPDEPASPAWATAYRPADGNLAVGGDWFDVVALGPSRWGVVVGDCSGHGLDAAARMGPLRSAGRALLLESHGPAAVLDGLDRFVRSLPGAEYTTVFCAVVDEDERSVTYATAGHPPALVLRAGEPVWLDGARSAPLAVGETGRREAVEPLLPGDTFVLYTDGLVERRGESLRTGLARLAATLAEIGDGEPQELAEEIIDRLLADGARDDVALVVHRPAAVPATGSDDDGLVLRPDDDRSAVA